MYAVGTASSEAFLSEHEDAAMSFRKQMQTTDGANRQTSAPQELGFACDPSDCSGNVWSL